MHNQTSPLFPATGTSRRANFHSLEILAAALVLAAGVARAEIPDIELSEFATGFRAPIWIQPVDAKASHYWVVEQPGAIRDLPASGGKKDDSTVVLDISARVNYGGEKGLLGLALHPKFAQNRRLFVNYTTGEDGKGKTRELVTRISEFKASADFKTVDPSSEIIVLEYAQPFSNHNGGQVSFGPDGLLYIGNGDGGSGNDPQGNGQKMGTLLGKFLRIDVDKKDAGKKYAIPKDNPFVGKDGVSPEIYSHGWRNPWRWSFDRTTGELWAGDVGQGKWEEIDLVEKGKNYGWKIMEGFHATPGIGMDNADQKGLVLPVVEYPRTLGDSKDLVGNSVTGGYVYRGTKNPKLAGVYFYGDFTTKRIWGLRYAKGKLQENREVGKAGSQLASFGEDADGELFVVGHGGTIWRLNQK